VGELELGRELSSTGEHGILNFNFNGKEEKALLKEVQRDPVSHKVIHIDLEEIGANKEIQSEVPIQFVGEEWLNNKGAVLQKEKAVVKVSCKPDRLPRAIKMDVSKGELGSIYRLGDLEVGEELSIIDDIKTVVASISNEKRLTSQLSEQEMENRDDKDNKKEEKKSE
jgi:large subunit ribosomal protein L25